MHGLPKYWPGDLYECIHNGVGAWRMGFFAMA